MAEVELRKPAHVSQPPKKVYMNLMRRLQQQRGQTTTAGSASGSATGSATGSESGSATSSASVEQSPALSDETPFTKISSQWDHTADDTNMTSSFHNPGQVALGLTSLCASTSPHCLPMPSPVHIGNDHICDCLDNNEHYLSCPGSQKWPTTEPSSSPVMHHRPVTESYQPSTSTSENVAATRRGNESRETVLVDSRVTDLSKNNQITVVSESSDLRSNDDALDVMWHGSVGSEVIPRTTLHSETDDPLHHRKGEPAACYEKLKNHQTSAVGGGQFVRSMSFVFGRDGENHCHLQSTTSPVSDSEMQGIKGQLLMQAFHSNVDLMYKENGGATNRQQCSSPNVHCASDSAMYHASRSSTLPLPYSSTSPLPEYQVTIDGSKSSSDLLHIPASVERRSMSQDVLSEWNEPVSSTCVSQSSVCHRSVGCPSDAKVGEYNDGSTMTSTQPDQAMTLETDSSSSEICQVCCDTAAGFHCGAYVCEACKVSLITPSLSQSNNLQTHTAITIQVIEDECVEAIQVLHNGIWCQISRIVFMKVYFSMSLALRGSGSVSDFPEKKRYVTLEWPLSVFTVTCKNSTNNMLMTS